MSSRHRILIVLSATLVGGWTVTASSGRTPDLALVSSRPAALGRALDTFDVARIRSDLAFVASDEMGGRDTPSTGLEATARYIVNRLQRLGFEAGAPDGFLYEYSLPWRQIDTRRSRLTVEGEQGAQELAFGSDYVFGGAADAVDLYAAGGVVSIGEGSGAELDAAEDSLEGNWALCLKTHRPIRRTAATVRKLGAVGLLVVRGPGEARFDERFDIAMESLVRGQIGPAGRDVFPKALLLDHAAAAFEVDGAFPEAGTRLAQTVSERRFLSPPGGRGVFENVCGIWPGSDPVLRSEVIIISAHYDHEGTKAGKIYNGADDNASGTAGLLALADALATYGPMRRSVMLLWVSGEEKGLLGSREWTLRPWLPPGMRPVADINLDMIGRNAPDELLITPTKRLRSEHNGLVRLAEALRETEGFRRFGSADEYWQRSDHMNFAVHLELPVTFLFADVHEDYHQPTDTIEKIDLDKIRRVMRLVLRMLDAMQEDELDLHRRAVPDLASFRRKVERGRALTDMEALWSALIDFYVLNGGEYPERLVQLVDGGHRDLADLPRDPWGHAYSYAKPQSPGERPRLASFGSDGTEGGNGSAEDILFVPGER